MLPESEKYEWIWICAVHVHECALCVGVTDECHVLVQACFFVCESASCSALAKSIRRCTYRIVVTIEEPVLINAFLFTVTSSLLTRSIHHKHVILRLGFLNCCVGSDTFDC
jgi:hypothetical protein